jgi:tetratricopeptide (TPR) repeat protein
MTDVLEKFVTAWKVYQSGRFSEAEQLYQQILITDPSQSEAWCLSGMCCQAQGKFAEAEAHFRKAVLLWPDHAVAQNGLAVALAQAGRLEEAADIFQRLLQSRPTDADAHNNLGLVRMRQGQLDDAIACFGRALNLRPNSPSTQDNLEIACQQKAAQSERLAAQLHQTATNPTQAAQLITTQALQLIEQRRFAEAKVELQRALLVEPANADASMNLANVFVRLERYDDAIAQYRHALRLNPNHFGGHYILGIALNDKGQHKEAAAHHRQALQLNPYHADAHNSLGVALLAQDELDEAAACFHRALKLSPKLLEARNNLGNVLERQDKLDEAAHCYEEAARLDPSRGAAINNLGMLFKRRGQLDAAMTCFEKALQAEVDYPSAHWNRAATWLLQGDFERGWPEYEWRWKQPEFGQRQFARPAWDGSSLNGKTILLYAEQGLGDTIQFVRYARLVQERGGTVIFQSSPALMSLLAGVAGVDTLVANNAPLPAFDSHAALLSLPGIFHTTASTMPANVPYLCPTKNLVEQWRQTLQARRAANGEEFLSPFRVGIAWQGNPAFRDDRQRSIPLAQFAPLLEVPGVQFVSLQKGPGTDQLRTTHCEVSLETPLTWTTLQAENRNKGSAILIPELDEGSGPFMDTAAVLQSLDLVICSDTAVGHLAGATGVPVWIALSLVPDWRWLLNREDCPWYPTMRLFRQARYGQWDGVFKRMAGELQSVVKEHRSAVG